MTIYDISGICLQRLALSVAVVFSLTVFNSDVVYAQLEQAIPYPRYVAPAPIGSPYVEWGPRANPFGPAPMPIGPSPYASRSPYRSMYGPSYGALNTYPQQGSARFSYPVDPYLGRTPTPFDPNALTVSPQFPQPTTVFGEQQQYSNHQAAPVPALIGNLRVSISEGFLNRLVARDEHKPGEVRDFILGAEVTGQQVTNTRLRFDLYPSPDKVLGALVMNGISQTQTIGVTPQAMIDTSSQQRFIATKDIIFDGMNLSTRHAVVHAQASNQNLGATTPLSGTLFGGIADRIAYRVAERRKPEAEAIARDRLVDRVYPEFDNEIDRQLGQANDFLENTLRRRLRAMNLMPSRQAVSSTDTAMTYSALVGNDYLISSVSTTEMPVVSGSGLQLQLHESFLNTLLGSFDLKRFKTTDKQIKALFAPYEVPSTEDERNKATISIPGAENIVTDIEFDDEDPLTFKLEKDIALVTLRAKFRPAGQDLFPDLAVTIEYRSEIVGNKILVTPGKVRVALQDDERGNGNGSIALKLVSQAVEASVTRLAFDRVLPSNLWSFGGIVPSVTSIRSADGWATIAIE